jgi:transcriptional regulator with XRE-family HTH domain
MTPLEIKHALERAGYTQARIARDCKVSSTTVNKVIKGVAVSTLVRCHIAKVINKPVTEVFTVKPNPTRRGPSVS